MRRKKAPACSSCRDSHPRWHPHGGVPASCSHGRAPPTLGPSASPGTEPWFPNCYLELREADGQGHQPVVEKIQVLEVDQAAKVSGQLLQLIFTQV